MSSLPESSRAWIKLLGVGNRLIRGGRWGSDAKGKKELSTMGQLEKHIHAYCSFKVSHISSLLEKSKINVNSQIKVLEEDIQNTNYKIEQYATNYKCT